VRPPYPTEIPPLLPLFLNKRRSKMTFPLQKTDELGIDRPTFIWTINLSYRGDRGATAEPGDLTSAYGTIPGRWLPMAAAARGAGLAEERDGRWYLTEKGRGLAAAMHEAATEGWKYGDPENHDLKRAIAARHGVTPAHVVVGEGIDALLAATSESAA